MFKNSKIVLGIGSVVSAIALFISSASAQVVNTWTTASTTALGNSAEAIAATNAYNMILVILGITLGLAAFFFALRWLWHRIAGRH